MARKEKSGEDPQQTPTESSPGETEETSQESLESQSSNLKPDGVDSETPQEPEELVVVPAEGAEVFQHPLLAGKSTEEVEELVNVQANALSSQNEELNIQHTRIQELQGAQPAAPAPVEEASPYGDGFMADGFEVLEKRLKSHQEAMIAPLREEMREDKAKTAREELRQELDLFTALEPHIDQLLREQGEDPRTMDKGLLTRNYYTVRGVAAEKGYNLNITETPTREEAPMGIPQHRPSSAPLPAEPAPTVRPLTENERILAHHQFPNSDDPEGEYRRMGSMEQDEIVKPGFSKELWK